MIDTTTPPSTSEITKLIDQLDLHLKVIQDKLDSASDALHEDAENALEYLQPNSKVKAVLAASIEHRQRLLDERERLDAEHNNRHDEWFAASLREREADAS